MITAYNWSSMPSEIGKCHLRPKHIHISQSLAQDSVGSQKGGASRDVKRGSRPCTRSEQNATHAFISHMPVCKNNSEGLSCGCVMSLAKDSLMLVKVV